MQELAEWTFGVSGLDAASDLRGDLSDYAPGSRNLSPDGVKESKPFKGLALVAGTGNGGRHMVQIKDSWGSLDDDGATPGKGSLFSTIADMLVYIGQGQVRVEGTSISGALASNILRLLLKWNGSYTDANSGPYAAGLPEPSAVVVGILSDERYGAPNLSGTVSVKYARFRKTTGGRSRASATSLVLVLTNKAIYAVVPAAVSGQTHHIFFGTSTKLGGIGLHYRIARANPFTNDEYTESDVERTVTITSITSTDKLNATAGTFSAGDIGKLVEGVSGLTFAAGTTVAEVISTSQIRLSAAISSGTAGTVKLIAYAGNVRRGVPLNWTPADLVEETAWIYDFPPPTGSHAFQLENRMFVAAYADSRARARESASASDDSASASSPGTALCPSIPNNFESYDPRFPVFMPEAVVDILSDGMDGYKFIGGKNGIYACMYLNTTDSVPATLSVLLRGQGIANANNWCARDRAIYLYAGKGQLVRIVEGGVVDKTFGNKVKHLMAGIDQADMVVFAHPRGSGVVYASGTIAWVFDEATERWSTDLGLIDVTATGVIMSAIATQSRAIVTMNNSGTRTAYYFDEGTSSFVAGVGHYQDTPAPERTKAIQRLIAKGVVDRIDRTAYVGIHANTLKTYVTDGAIPSASNLFTSAGSAFTSELLGSYILIRGAGAAGGFLFGRIIQVVSGTQLTIGLPVADMTAATALNASTTVTAAYCLIAHRIFPVKPLRVGTFETQSGEMYLPGLSSYAVSMLIETSGGNAQPLKMGLGGMVNEEEGWGMPGSTFGQTV